MPRAALPAPPPAVLAQAQRAKRKKTGGRGKGARNKKTLERQILKTIEDDMAEGKPVRLMAKEVLDQFMNYFAGLASYYQPGTPEQPNSNADETKFEKYALIAKGFADSLVRYQSPTLKAIMVTEMSKPAAVDQPGMRGGKVIEINDAKAAARVYQQMMREVG